MPELPLHRPIYLSSEVLEAPCSRQAKDQFFLLSCQRMGLEGICKVTKIHHVFLAGISEKNKHPFKNEKEINKNQLQVLHSLQETGLSLVDNAGKPNYRSSNLERNQY